MQLSPFLTVFPLFRYPSALRLREPTELLRRGTRDAIDAKRNNRYSVALLLTARA